MNQYFAIQTIGILGGGQLGRIMALAARAMAAQQTGRRLPWGLAE
jgi:hypothetical protein